MRIERGREGKRRGKGEGEGKREKGRGRGGKGEGGNEGERKEKKITEKETTKGKKTEKTAEYKRRNEKTKNPKLVPTLQKLALEINTNPTFGDRPILSPHQLPHMIHPPTHTLLRPSLLSFPSSVPGNKSVTSFVTSLATKRSVT